MVAMSQSFRCLLTTNLFSIIYLYIYVIINRGLDNSFIGLTFMCHQMALLQVINKLQCTSLSSDGYSSSCSSLSQTPFYISWNVSCLIDDASEILDTSVGTRSQWKLVRCALNKEQEREHHEAGETSLPDVTTTRTRRDEKGGEMRMELTSFHSPPYIHGNHIIVIVVIPSFISSSPSLNLMIHDIPTHYTGTDYSIQCNFQRLGLFLSLLKLYIWSGNWNY